MMFLRYHIILAATAIIYYGSTTGVLAAPISASSQLAPRQTGEYTSLDAREFDPSSAKPVAPRMYNPSLNDRAIIIDSQTQMETREYHLYYSREPRGKSGLTRSERQDRDKAALRASSSSPKGPKLTRAEKQDRDKAALRALSAPSTSSEEHHHGALAPKDALRASSSSPKGPKLTRAEKQDRDKAALRALSAPPTSEEHHHVDLASPQAEHYHDDLALPQVEHHHDAPQQVEQPLASKSSPGGMLSKVQNHWLVTKAKSWFGRSKTATN